MQDGTNEQTRVLFAALPKLTECFKRTERLELAERFKVAECFKLAAHILGIGKHVNLEHPASIAYGVGRVLPLDQENVNSFGVFKDQFSGNDHRSICRCGQVQLLLCRSFRQHLYPRLA
ncbi:unannotated protein [freshwater metagenome]|uniref:Unannotated protein n=1 Tax=freshwater metagenome TaxID=449393 RepID=A0A6J7P870_9ZZZZ